MTAPIVTVRGEAHQEVAPDLASLSVSAHASGSSAERVRSVLAQASARIAEIVASRPSGIERSGSSQLSVSPVYDSRTGTTVTGYRGSFSTTVVVSDIELLSPLVLAFGDLPDAELSGPWWSLRPDHPVHREVRLAAIADARRRAVDYAAAFGATLTGLVEVSDLEAGFGGGRPEMRAFAMGKDSGGSGFDFEPALQAVSGQITARFTLSDVNLD